MRSDTVNEVMEGHAEASLLAERSLQIRGGLHFARIQGEGVVLDLVQDRYLGLFALGAAIWQALASGHSREQAVRTLVSGHELSPPEAEAAVDEELASWMESRLLIPDDETDASSSSLRAKPPGVPTSEGVSVEESGHFGLISILRLLRARFWAGRWLRRGRPDQVLAELASDTCFAATMVPSAGRTVAAYRWMRKLLAREDDCLVRTVTLARALQTQGIPCDICFGARKVPFFAHSWVEIGGRSVDSPRALARLTVVARF